MNSELQLLDGMLNLGVIPLTPGHTLVGSKDRPREATDAPQEGSV